MASQTGNEEADYRRGTLVLLVGPSGSGKDSLLAYARAKLLDDPAILFVRRCITRKDGDPNEDHESMGLEEFPKGRAARALCHFMGRAWSLLRPAYDLARPFGQRRCCYRQWISQKHTAFERTIPAASRRKPDRCTRYSRQATCSAWGVKALTKLKEDWPELPNYPMTRFLEKRPTHLDNSGPLDIAGDAFVALVKRFAKE